MFYKFSREGLPATESEKSIFLSEVDEMCKKNETDHVFISIHENIPTNKRMMRFFYVLAEYITIQNYYPSDPSRNDIEATSVWLTDNFIPNKSHRVMIGKEWIEVKSIKSKTKLSVNQMKILIQNIISWADSQGYIIPDTEDFHRDAQKVGMSIARKNMIEELKMSLQKRMT